jgi:hypothetical protein
MDAGFSGYAFVVHGTSVMLSFSTPTAQKDAYSATATRSANSFHASD